MSASASQTCLRCNTSMIGNGGVGREVHHGIVHGAVHGLTHGSPLMLGTAAAGLLFPRKLTCPRCGYLVKA